MESTNTLFPQTKFVAEYISELGLAKAVSKQLTVVSSELFEVQDAFSQHDNTHTIEEVVDVVHAAQQLIYMIPGGKETYDRVSKEVITKNDRRGYYDA